MWDTRENKFRMILSKAFISEVVTSSEMGNMSKLVLFCFLLGGSAGGTPNTFLREGGIYQMPA